MKDNKFQALAMFLNLTEWKDERKGVKYFKARVLLGAFVLKCKISEEMYDKFVKANFEAQSQHSFIFELGAYAEDPTISIVEIDDVKVNGPK